MKLFTEFLDRHKALKKELNRQRKVRKPEPPNYASLPRLDIETAEQISNVTNLDPYLIQDLIRGSDFTNPIIEQPLKDLFMGLMLTYDGERSSARAYADDIRSNNRSKKDAYDEKMAAYHAAMDARSKLPHSILTDWFDDIIDNIVDNINKGIDLPLEEKILIDSIASCFNKCVIIDGVIQPQILKSLKFEFSDVIHIMRHARKKYASGV